MKKLKIFKNRLLPDEEELFYNKALKSYQNYCRKENVMFQQPCFYLSFIDLIPGEKQDFVEVNLMNAKGSLYSQTYEYQQTDNEIVCCFDLVCRRLLMQSRKRKLSPEQRRLLNKLQQLSN